MSGMLHLSTSGLVILSLLKVTRQRKVKRKYSPKLFPVGTKPSRNLAYQKIGAGIEMEKIQQNMRARCIN